MEHEISCIDERSAQERGGFLQEETQFTKRYDCVQKSEGLREPSVDSGEPRLTGFHHHDEKQKIEVASSEGKRDKDVLVVEEDGGWRTEQYSSGGLKGKRTNAGV